MPFLVDRERDTEAAEAVRAFLEASTFWGITPTRVVLHRQEDASGEEAWIFEVNLPDPDSVSGTWPVQALNEFARAGRNKALEASVSWPWHIVFFPEHDEEQADEDQIQLPDV